MNNNENNKPKEKTTEEVKDIHSVSSEFAGKVEVYMERRKNLMRRLAE